jgi:hypothetical protein
MGKSFQLDEHSVSRQRLNEALFFLGSDNQNGEAFPRNHKTYNGFNKKRRAIK